MMPLFVISKRIVASLWHYVILGENHDMKRIRENEERQLLSSKKHGDTSVLHRNKQDVCVPNVAPPQGFVAEILGDAPNTPNERMVL